MNIQKEVFDEPIGLQALSAHGSGVSSAMATPHPAARAVMAQPVTDSVYVSFDGTVPSAAYGFLLVGNQRYTFSAELLRSARARGVASTVTVIHQSLA